MTVLYCTEMGQAKPAALFEARLSYYGTHYYVDTPCTLKGRGITEEPANWAPNSQKAREGWKTYRLTEKAYKKLEAEHTIIMEDHLD